MKKSDMSLVKSKNGFSEIVLLIVVLILLLPFVVWKSELFRVDDGGNSVSENATTKETVTSTEQVDNRNKHYNKYTYSEGNANFSMNIPEGFVFEGCFNGLPSAWDTGYIYNDSDLESTDTICNRHPLPIIPKATISFYPGSHEENQLLEDAYVGTDIVQSSFDKDGVTVHKFEMVVTEEVDGPGQYPIGSKNTLYRFRLTDNTIIQLNTDDGNIVDSLNISVVNSSNN